MNDRREDHVQNCRSTSTVTTDIKNGDIAKRMEAFEIIKGKKEQGRIHSHQLLTGGQGRIYEFSYFSTRADGRTD